MNKKQLEIDLINAKQIVDELKEQYDEADGEFYSTEELHEVLETAYWCFEDPTDCDIYSDEELFEAVEEIFEKWNFAWDYDLRTNPVEFCKQVEDYCRDYDGYLKDAKKKIYDLENQLDEAKNNVEWIKDQINPKYEQASLF